MLMCWWGFSTCALPAGWQAARERLQESLDTRLLVLLMQDRQTLGLVCRVVLLLLVVLCQSP